MLAPFFPFTRVMGLYVLSKKHNKQDKFNLRVVYFLNLKLFFTQQDGKQLAESFKPANKIKTQKLTTFNNNLGPLDSLQKKKKGFTLTLAAFFWDSSWITNQRN